MSRQGSATVPPRGDSPADQTCLEIWVVAAADQRGRAPCPHPCRRRVLIRPGRLVRARVGVLVLCPPLVAVGPAVGTRPAVTLHLAPPTLLEVALVPLRHCSGTRCWLPRRMPRVGPPPRLPSAQRPRRLLLSSSRRNDVGPLRRQALLAAAATATALFDKASLPPAPSLAFCGRGSHTRYIL